MAKVIVNRNDDDQLSDAIERLKKHFGLLSATKAVEKAIFFMVDELPGERNTTKETNNELKETRYLLKRIFNEVEAKREAETSIDELIRIYKA